MFFQPGGTRCQRPLLVGEVVGFVVEFSAEVREGGVLPVELGPLAIGFLALAGQGLSVVFELAFLFFQVLLGVLDRQESLVELGLLVAELALLGLKFGEAGVELVSFGGESGSLSLEPGCIGLELLAGSEVFVLFRDEAAGLVEELGVLEVGLFPPVLQFLGHFREQGDGLLCVRGLGKVDQILVRHAAGPSDCPGVCVHLSESRAGDLSGLGGTDRQWERERWDSSGFRHFRLRTPPCRFREGGVVTGSGGEPRLSRRGYFLWMLVRKGCALATSSRWHRAEGARRVFTAG